MNLPKILLIDDEQAVLDSLSLSLEGEALQIVTCSDAQAALKALQEQSFSVIIADQNMPTMTGMSLLQESKKSSPLSSRILITGNPALDTVVEAINQDTLFHFLTKPWSREELLATIHNGIRHYQLLRTNANLQKKTQVLNEQLSESNRELQVRLSEITRHTLQLNHNNKALQQNLDQSLQLTYHMVNSCHPLLGKQTKAIVEICEQMMKSESLSQDEKHQLYVSAWLQNIGLVGSSRELIFQRFREPDILSQDARTHIEQAPIVAESLASFHDNLAHVGKIIRAVHERWDGKGYPDGLTGHMIPRPARYLAVIVNFVESGLNHQAAMKMIEKESGKKLDPEAVRLFFQISENMSLPPQIREVTFGELREDMTLAQSIHSPTGLLLMPDGHTFSAKSLAKLEYFNELYPIEDRLLVYR